MSVLSSKPHYIIITLILTLPHINFHPFPRVLVSAAAADSEIIIGIYPPGPSLKEWGRNTNFGNVDNWQGLRGYENCSGNIYSFSWYLDESVVLLPKVFIAKQILLPVNGHFVFQEGATTFLSGSSSSTSPAETTCHGREVKFQRTSRADWFDPDNWIRGNEKDDGSQKSRASLLNAVPHVERVPCQYDSVRFPANSSFNLKIEENITIANFYVGNKKQSYNDVALLMNSELGKLQFQKAPETIFSIRDNDKGSTSTVQGCDYANTDNDKCICSNYEKDMKQKICALAKCSGWNEEDGCQNPITPHGFCCPICGVHVKIRHTGNLALVPLYTKLRRELKERKLGGLVAAHLSRHHEKGAHLIVVPSPNSGSNKSGGDDDEHDVVGKLVDLVVRFQSILKEEKEVLEVTVTESWERLPPSSGASDRSQGSALGGGLITLIVILLLLTLLAGVALFIFIWNKKHGYPPMTLSSVTSVLHRMPSMSIIPIVPGRRSSTISTNLHSFGFARFTNERASSVTISPDGGGSGGQSGKEGGVSPKPAKSSSIRRTEQVDDDVADAGVLPTTIEVPETVSDANSGGFGFSNVTYDLIGGVGEEGPLESVAGEDNMQVLDVGASPNTPFPVLTIPEVTIVDVDNSGGGSTSGVKEKKSETSAPASSANKEKVGGIGGKFTKPTFVTSRMAMAYQKLGPEEEQQQGSSSSSSSSPGESSGRKKGKSKKAVKSADTNTEGKQDDAHSKDQDHHRQEQQQQHQVERVEQDAQLVDVGDDDGAKPDVPPVPERKPRKEE